MGKQECRKIRLEIIAIAILCLTMVGGLPERVLAAGFFLYEIGTPDVGLASAGYASRAQDASTVFTNPAGMTRLDSSQFLIGLQPIYGYEAFSPNGHTTKAGTDGGNALVPLPGGSFFYVYKLTPNLRLGIGDVTYFGGAGVQPELGRQVLPSRRDDSWKQHSAFDSLAYQQVVISRSGLQRNDWLSEGEGGDQQCAPQLQDGQLRFNG